ncbi:MAG: 3-hydroxybutyrate dehydrogenase [Jiangellaceae bacterium]
MATRSVALLAGRTALVTGAASGIGHACAVRLAADGAHVIALDRDGEGAARTAKEAGGQAVTCDLADLDAIDALPFWGTGVDIVVNNAGIQHVAPIHEFDPDVFNLIVAVMLVAPFRVMRRALPQMYARGWGRVVNVSSVHGWRASPFKSAYVTAKHGLEGLSKVVALEGAEHGVTSNCIAPGYVRTPLVEDQIADQARQHGVPEADVIRDVMLAGAAIKRLVEPDEVAELTAWLCGPSAAMVTGASFVMDGGWTAH